MPSTATDGIVNVHRLLEPDHERAGLRAEDPVDLHGKRVAGQVTERPLLLHPADRLAPRPQLDGDHQRAPGGRTDDAVDRQLPLLLEGPDGVVGLRTEDPVDDDVVVAGPEQALERPHRVVLRLALPYQGPCEVGHDKLPVAVADPGRVRRIGHAPMVSPLDRAEPATR